MAFITVVIPTYNRHVLLQRAVRSVLAQEHEDFELVVVDDASPDVTQDVVESIRDSRVRYLRREKNGSAGAARNTGVKAARGEWICFLDDDDEYLPDYLRRMNMAFEQAAPEIGFGWCGVRTVRDEKNGEEETVGETAWTPSYASREEAHRAILRSRRIGTNAGFVVRKSVFQHLGGFDELLPKAEDTEYLIRLSKSYDFVAVPDILVKVHLHEGPRLTTYDHRMAVAYERIMELHDDSIQSSPELAAAYHYKTGWLHYHAGNKRAGRMHCLKALQQRPAHLKTWAVMGLFELLGEHAIPLHRRLSEAR